MTKKKITILPIEEEKLYPDPMHLVFYTDGSAKPNPGPWGSGVHGYFYNEESIGKATGDRPTNYAITNIGYLDKNEVTLYQHQSVKPSHYFNSITAGRSIGTNNIGEVTAIISVINHALELDMTILSVTINCDSTYALGIIKTITNDANRSWDIDRPNIELWYSMQSMITKLKRLKIQLHTRKVLAHADVHGNNLTDRLAYIGRYMSSLGKPGYISDIRPAARYWKGKPVKNPLIDYRQLFFTNEPRNPTERNQYNIISYPTAIDVGTKSNEAIYGVALLRKPIPIIDDVMNEYNHNMRHLSTITSIDLTTVYSQTHILHKEIFGAYIYAFNLRRRMMSVMEEKTITNSVYPAGLVSNSMDKINRLRVLLDDYIDDNLSDHILVDITDNFYTINDKGKRICNVLTTDKLITTEVTINKEKHKVVFVIGKDILSRNSIKRLEKTINKVMLVVTVTGEHTAEYYTIFDNSSIGDYGVYCNYYTNKLFL